MSDTTVSPDRSTGRYPDGQAGPQQTFFHAHARRAPTTMSHRRCRSSLNEWMAANSTFLADPADGHTDDWFELFNPNDVVVDLAGYALADNPAGSPRWTIPPAPPSLPMDFSWSGQMRM